ncbi:polysaccharide pyruvyl transferase family protein [Actinotalea sp. M2MS4P-6]|uniref:polysaccharide pyruvyl transferase family protein n=1 Tax=Actinotalea sp. M2MS4P-6 TaxID=2983762 RepID=UPI0021E43DB3|nr:polysaccharide pyruvyl transferase family protein [Actinotalea sp. M2MS4P-6]MCV2395815.1 polysaccharide pyruvyl transferase family protein [Actinotalea sp. M2MS4P-6]
MSRASSTVRVAGAATHQERKGCMRALVTWASDTSPNLGVRALAQGTEALLRRVWPDVEVEHQNFGRGAAPMPIGRTRSLVKERVTGRAGLMAWLRGFDLVVDTRSGDSFADIYGVRRLQRMTAFAELVAQAKVPLVLGPQTVGPFDHPLGRALGRWTLRRTDLVMVRDGESAACAEGLGRTPDVHTTDVVFALPQPDVPRDRDVVLNVSGLLWRPGPHVDAAAYRRTVTDLLDRLGAEGRTVTLLAHVLDSDHPDNDVPAVRELTAARGLEAVVPAGLEEVRETVASATLVIGSRMHACLNALSVGTPAIPLAYSRKFAPLLGELGWGATVDLRTAEDPVADVMRRLTDDLAQQSDAVVDRAQALLRPAEDALRGLL